MTTFDAVTQSHIDSWLSGSYDQETKAAIQHMVNTDPNQAVDAFFTKLSFGTGGLRGLMGVGTNRMNQYTVMTATQGLANYLRQQSSESQSLAVCIGYDCRHSSRAFAEVAAQVLAGNGIRVKIFSELRPTPLVSFACRELHCSAAIVITASHNPPEYNGYKVYWYDGGQIVPPQDAGIIAEVNKINDISQVKQAALTDLLIEWLGEEVDDMYLAAMRPLQHYPKENRKHGREVKIIFSSLHGTGITLVPKILTDWGFLNYMLVPEQTEPDGSFPTVKSPNPEERAALQLGINLMKKVHADLLIATDPDADRMGVAVTHGDRVEILDGNQIACICLEHVLRAFSKQHRLPNRPAVIKTIVTTELFRRIAEAYGLPCFEVLTGFKYIAHLIHQWEQSPDGYQYLFGGEESFGYLLGTAVRDKDAIISSALICEVALQAKLGGKTLVDLLHRLYQKYGVYREKLVNIHYGDGKASKDKMDDAMAKLRASPPAAIYGIPVLYSEDLLTSSRTDLTSGKTVSLSLPKSNVFRLFLNDGSQVVVRPSGTEPKIKLYGGVSRPSLSGDHSLVIAQCDVLVSNLLDSLVKQLTN